jgi:hypothetical protein
LLFVVLDNAFDAPYFGGLETNSIRDANRVQPEFRFFLFSSDMNMWWLVSVTYVEKQPVGTDSENCWHVMLRSFDSLDINGVLP